MAVEQIRGCGFRKVGGLYICGGGQGMNCDRLPYELEVCPVCGAGVKFTRGWTWLDWWKYAGDHENCNDHRLPRCVVCEPIAEEQPYGLLWVGEASYTPQAFVQEALTMGVSRRIAAVPKNLKLGETWVLFAYKKAIAIAEHITGSGDLRPGNFQVTEFKSAVFYAFRPTSLELLVWESEAKPEYLEDLAKRNITPIIIPDGDEDHDPSTKTKMSADDREEVSREHTIAALRAKIGR